MVQRSGNGSKYYVASYAYSDEPPKRVIAKTILRCKGNLLKTAFHLGIHRSHLYRLTYKHRLWPLINQIRKNTKLEKHNRKIVRGIYV